MTNNNNEKQTTAVATAREIGKAIQTEEVQKAKVAKAVAEYTCSLTSRVKALSLSLTPFCYEDSTVVIIRGRDIKPMLIARKSTKGSGVIFEASYNGSKVPVTYTKVDGKKTAVDFNADEREAQGVFDKLALNIKNSVNPLINSLASIAGTYDDIYSLAVAQESERNEAMAKKLGLVTKED
ncbi:MAG: hypothetical protein ACQGQO_04575 [Sphaerochaetaceae bacterium]